MHIIDDLELLWWAAQNTLIGIETLTEEVGYQ